MRTVTVTTATEQLRLQLDTLLNYQRAVLHADMQHLLAAMREYEASLWPHTPSLAA